MAQQRRTIAILEVLFAVIAWGGSFIATKLALRDVSPITIVWARFAIGVAILGVAIFKRGQWALPQRRDLPYFALLGFLGITFHQWLQSNGLVTSMASTTAWIVATTPVFMAMLGWLFLKERLGTLQILGIVLAAFGVILVVSRGEFAMMFQGRFGAPGDILILLSAPNWAVFSALSRKGLSQHPATRMMFYVMLAGWLFTSILFFMGPGLREIRNLTPEGWMGIGFLGVACSGLAYIFWYDALQVLPVAQTGAFLYLEPFVTLLVAAAVLGEAIVLTTVLGGGAILFGVWMVNRPQSKRRFT